MRTFVILLALAGISCGDMGESIGPFEGTLLGSFHYSAFDSTGIPIAQGSLTLFRRDSIVSGFWWFRDGRSGELAGSIAGDQIDLNLNPQFVDHNLLLRGLLVHKTYSGEWFQIGFAGIMARGTFAASSR